MSQESLTVGLDLSSEPDRPTGVGRYAQCLAKALGELAGHPEHPGVRVVAFAPPGLRVRGLPTFSTPFGERSYAWRRLYQQTALPLRTLAHGVDLIHSVNNLTPLASPLPRVLSFQDAKLYRAAAGGRLLQRLYRRELHRRAARGATLVLAASEFSRQESVDALGVDPARVRVVPYGVEAERFAPDPERSDDPVLESYGLRNAPYALVVATREPAKNLSGALEAFARAVTRRPELTLVLCGSVGWGDQNLEGRAQRLGVRDRLRPLGYVPDEDLPSLYRGARAFLFPSRIEGFGLPILEAFAAGTPVVTSTTSACPQTAGDAALLADPDDVEGIADALARAVADGEEREGLIARGRARAAEMTWERCALGTLAVYREAYELAGS